ncbi:MAG TPA: SgcJ/EcaC family oxidoreductase [Roseiflexaceae bacterium]|jgi:uncharacterized protein (TIGR02246 family)
MEFQAQASQSSDEALVRSLYAQLMQGWNAGSGAAFAAPFAEDGDLVAFDGTHFKGRQAIIDFQQPLFDRWLKGTRLVGEVQSVRFLNPDIAVMHAIGGTVMRGKAKPDPARDSIQTLVAVRSADTWQLAAFQNTRLRPMSRSFAAVLLWNFTDWLWSFLLRKR